MAASLQTEAGLFEPSDQIAISLRLSNGRNLRAASNAHGHVGWVRTNRGPSFGDLGNLELECLCLIWIERTQSLVRKVLRQKIGLAQNEPGCRERAVFYEYGNLEILFGNLHAQPRIIIPAEDRAIDDTRKQIFVFRVEEHEVLDAGPKIVSLVEFVVLRRAVGEMECVVAVAFCLLCRGTPGGVETPHKMPAIENPHARRFSNLDAGVEFLTDLELLRNARIDEPFVAFLSFSTRGNC